MSRLVDLNITQNIAAKIVVRFSSGSINETILNVGDVIEGLRWVEDEEVKSITGRVSKIHTACLSVTKVNVNSPKDNFNKDVRVTSIVVDYSTEYESKLVTVDAKEVVEFEGQTDVVKVDVIPYPTVDMEFIYSDDTVVTNTVAIGDLIKDAVIMTELKKADITGDFFVKAFQYNVNLNKINITGFYLYNQEVGYILAKLEKFISFNKVPKTDITDSASLSSIAAALELEDEVSISVDVDVEIPIRDDGKITTVLIGEGKTVDLDLNGHSITTQAYAFYVNGGTLNISDNSGNGTIKATIPNKAYPAVYVANGGTCNMESGTIDTTDVDDSGDNVNWLYGVVCSGDGVFNMTGGKMIIGAASGISITNGTASGEGARFTIGGDAVITSKECAAIYLADNKSVVIKDNAIINGGIVARMGDIIIKDKAKVNAQTNLDVIESVGELACVSGVTAVASGILGLTGVYNSALGNDLNITIEGNSPVITSKYGNAIEIGLVNTLYDQKAEVNVASNRNLESSWRVYSHDELAEQASAAGKTLKPEATTTDLTIKIKGEVVYPTTPNTVEGGE